MEVTKRYFILSLNPTKFSPGAVHHISHDQHEDDAPGVSSTSVILAFGCVHRFIHRCHSARRS